MLSAASFAKPCRRHAKAQLRRNTVNSYTTDSSVDTFQEDDFFAVPHVVVRRVSVANGIDIGLMAFTQWRAQYGGGSSRPLRSAKYNADGKI